MDRRRASTGLMLAASSLAMIPMRLWADDEHDHDSGDARSSVTFEFGAGLNTAQPGNAANHHVLPRVIKVRKGGVVNFIVAGFHQLMVYFPGVGPDNIALPPTGTLFINDATNLYYRDMAPAGGPPPATAAIANPSNAVNRAESVSFVDAGDYLVVCNVRLHFVDGMYAVVKVR